MIALLLGNLLLAAFQAADRKPERSKPGLEQRTLPAGLPSIPLAEEMQAVNGELDEGGQCYALGPFETEASRQRARDSIESLASAIVERRTEALMELGYWVALPPFAGFAEAAEAENDLRRAGLEDVAVVNGLDGEFLVSLGYFLDEKNALARRDQVRALGLEAVTRLQRENQPRYWLDYAVTESGPALPTAIGPGLQRQIPCPSGLTALTRQTGLN